jgi:MFS family permease
MGLGGALIMPATLSIISNVFPREERGKAIGVWAGMASIGIGLGPLCGGLLLEYFDWSSVFLLNVPVAATAFLLGIRFVPQSRDPHPGAFDLVGAGLSVSALVALVYPIIEARSAAGPTPASWAASVWRRRSAGRSCAGSCTPPSRCSTSPSCATRASPWPR